MKVDDMTPVELSEHLKAYGKVLICEICFVDSWETPLIVRTRGEKDKTHICMVCLKNEMEFAAKDLELGDDDE